MRELNQQRLAELQVIREKHGGTLPPHVVVDFARDPNTALHSVFEWDEGRAAEQYRLHQARGLIRIMVVIENIGGADRVVRPFVSIMQDRRRGVGYRALSDVMEDEELREQLLATALVELRGVQKRYRELRELTEVFDAIDAVVERRVRPTPSRGGDEQQASMG